MPLVQRREPFDDHHWIFELKYDGFRALAHVLGGKPRLPSTREPFDELVELCSKGVGVLAGLWFGP